jgi:hypothetical protein
MLFFVAVICVNVHSGMLLSIISKEQHATKSLLYHSDTLTYTNLYEAVRKISAQEELSGFSDKPI